jgi:hypothetical protein
MTIETKFDIPFVANLALREKQIQQNYRPIIAVHKWFARRPGSLFRALALAEFGDAPLADLYFTGNDFPHRKVADPFMGGGTPLIEANRIGCDVTGFDINPMAAWIVREEIEHLDIDAYRKEAGALLDKLRIDIQELYLTDCPVYGDAGQSATLEATFTRLLPDIPAPAGKAVGGRVRRALRVDVRAAEHRSRVLLSVGEAIGKQEVQHLVPPVRWRGMKSVSLREARPRDRDFARRRRLKDLCNVVHRRTPRLRDASLPGRCSLADPAHLMQPTPAPAHRREAPTRLRSMPRSSSANAGQSCPTRSRAVLPQRNGQVRGTSRARACGMAPQFSGPAVPRPSHQETPESSA